MALILWQSLSLSLLLSHRNYKLKSFKIKIQQVLEGDLSTVTYRQ